MQPTPTIAGRQATRSYLDPVERIWLTTAGRLGMAVQRADHAYASWDGAGTLTLGTPETLDSDDCLAQMILHEICHWIANGTDSIEQIDWGFEPTEFVDWREYPAIRLQGWLAEAHGLRTVLGPTTNARDYYDRVEDWAGPLGDDPVEARIVEHTVAAMQRARAGRWWRPVQQALAATAMIRRVTDPFTLEGEPGDLWGSFPG